MGYMATWGPKGFLVSPQKIVPLDGLISSVTLKPDSENDTSGTSPTNTKGFELQPVSFSTTYFRGAGVDPWAQWEEWCSLVGSVHPLYVGEKLFGPPKLKLKQVNITESKMDLHGNFIYIAMAFTFEEYVESAKTTTKAKTSSSSRSSVSSTSSTATKSESAERAAAVYAATVEKKKAMNTGASTSDKAAKK